MQKAIQWEIGVSKPPENLTDFCNEFLGEIGFYYSGTVTDQYGTVKASYNNKFMFGYALQEDNKITLQIKELIQ